jgi:group I intron endonuclease
MKNYWVDFPNANKTGVYKITNKINGKTYYGSTKDSFRVRWNGHKRELRNNIHHCQRPQRSYNKHGGDAFEYRIILLCEPEECKYYEQCLLDLYWDNGKRRYNPNKLATHPDRTGHTHKQETKKKIRLAHISKANHYYADYNEPRAELISKTYTEQELIDAEKRRHLHGWADRVLEIGPALEDVERPFRLLDLDQPAGRLFLILVVHVGQASLPSRDCQ